MKQREEMTVSWSLIELTELGADYIMLLFNIIQWLSIGTVGEIQTPRCELQNPLRFFSALFFYATAIWIF